MDTALETLYLDADGKVTNDPAESHSLLVSEGSPLREDVKAKIEADGYNPEAKAKSAPPATKAVTIKETK